MPESFSSINVANEKSLLDKRCLLHLVLKVPDQSIVAVVFRVQHQPFLSKLQLVHEKHDKNADQQGHEC